MPRLTETKIKAIAAEYLLNGGNKVKSLIKVGYSKLYAERKGKLLFNNVQVLTEIQRMQAKIELKCDVTREEVTENARYLVELGKKANNGTDIAAGNMQLGKIIGAFSEGSFDNTAERAELKALSDAETVELQAIARERLLRMNGKVG